MYLKLISSGATFLLPDVGVLIEADPGSVFENSKLLLDLAQSANLRARVEAGTVVVNDGSMNLTPSGGLQYLIHIWTQGGEDSAVRPPAALSTGILFGGNLSVNALDNTKFDLTAGYGIIVNNVSDPEKPTLRFVEWDAMVGVSDPNIATSTETYISIDGTGTLIFHTLRPTPEDRRDFIHIGWTSHPDYTSLEDAYTEPFLTFDVLCQLEDFLESFGAFNIDGNVFSPYANLKVSRSAGITFDNGTNYRSSAKNPHRLSTPVESPVAELWYFYRDPGDPSGWKNDLPVLADVDPEHWDDGTGVLATVPTGKFTIQMITFYAPWEATDIQYGQGVYDTLELALAAIPPTPVLNPWNSEWDTLRGWMIVQQGATDLTNPAQARFITITRFGMIQSVGGGSVIGEINTASNQGLSGQGLYLGKSGVDLQFKNIHAASTKITVANNAGQKTVDIDLGPHAPMHQNGGTDQMSVAGLTGLLGTPQTPIAHKDTHKSGGTDALLSTDLLEAVVKRIQESAGPTNLTVGAVADGHLLRRNGTAIEGVARPSASEATATGATSTTSTSDVPIAGMTLTPGAGTYLAWFSATVAQSNGNTSGYVSLYAAGAKIAHSERRWQRGVQTVETPVATHAIITVVDGQAIEARWRTAAGTFSGEARSLLLLKIA